MPGPSRTCAPHPLAWSLTLQLRGSAGPNNETWTSAAQALGLPPCHSRIIRIITSSLRLSPEDRDSGQGSSHLRWATCLPPLSGTLPQLPGPDQPRRTLPGVAGPRPAGDPCRVLGRAAPTGLGSHAVDTQVGSRPLRKAQLLAAADLGVWSARLDRQSGWEERALRLTLGRCRGWAHHLCVSTEVSFSH